MSSGIVLHRDSLHPEMDFDKLKLGQKYCTEKFSLISCMLCMLHLALLEHNKVLQWSKRLDMVRRIEENYGQTSTGCLPVFVGNHTHLSAILTVTGKSIP